MAQNKRHIEVAIPGVQTFGMPFPGDRSAPARRGPEAPAYASRRRRLVAALGTTMIAATAVAGACWALGGPPSGSPTMDWLDERSVRGAALALSLFVLSTICLVGTVGAGPGGLMMRLRVARIDGSRARPGIARAAARILLLLLPGILTGGLWWVVVAVLVARPGNTSRRGPHELASGTLTVSRSTPARPATWAANGPGTSAWVPQAEGSRASALDSSVAGDVTGTAGVAPADSDAAVRRWRVEVVDGPARLLDRVCVIGRESAERPAEHEEDFIGIRDHLVSKRHGMFALDRGQVTYTDLGSTNGSIASRGGRQRRISPHQPLPLKPGDTVLVGDQQVRVTLLE